MWFLVRDVMSCTINTHRRHTDTFFMSDEQTEQDSCVVLESNLTKVRYSPYPCRQRRPPTRFVFPDDHRCTDDYGSHDHDSNPFGDDSDDSLSSMSSDTEYSLSQSTSEDDTDISTDFTTDDEYSN